MNDIDIKDLVIAALKKREIKVYRGTILDETLDIFVTAKKDRDISYEEFLAKKKEFWCRVYRELGLDPDKSYHVEPLTGQVFEDVPISEFKDDPGKETVEHETTEAKPEQL